MIPARDHSTIITTLSRTVVSKLAHFWSESLSTQTSQGQVLNTPTQLATCLDSDSESESLPLDSGSHVNQ